MDSPRALRHGKRRGEVAEGPGCRRTANQFGSQRGDQTVGRSQSCTAGHQHSSRQRARAAEMIRPKLLSDSHGRVMRDLRVSVTDRCNFRCLYCLPETEEAADFYRVKYDGLRNPSPPTPITREWKPRSQILSFEEIERVVRMAVELGIQK